jgi:hypothetical protein
MDTGTFGGLPQKYQCGGCCARKALPAERDFVEQTCRLQEEGERRSISQCPILPEIQFYVLQIELHT